MTFHDLKKKVLQSQQQQQTTRLSDLFANKPFWIWDINEHIKADLDTNGDCCFNHIVGLPKKEGVEKPIFDYQKTIYDSLLIKDVNNPLNLGFKHKHLWIKKATGLGVTEFFLRFMCWLCLKDNTYMNAQMCIVTGPNIDIAIKLIKRMKTLFEPKLKITFGSKETVLELNGCTIEAYPSNHLDAYRALDNPKFILIDEADFFRRGEQEDVRHVSERYIAKSDPYIVMVSTPNAPDGLFEKIEHEPEKSCLYKRLKLDYTCGLGKIYKQEEIENAKSSPSFEREYNLKYLGVVGNVFLNEAFDWSLVDPTELEINPYTIKSMGIDPGFGSSAFGICVTQFNNGKIEVIYADEFNRSSYEDMVNLFWEIKEKIGNLTNVYVDASFPAIIKTLKKEVGEADDWEYVKKTMEYCKKNHMDIEDAMVVVPVAFGNNGGVELLQNAKMILEDNSRLVKISRDNEKLIAALRTAWADGFRLDKDQTSYDDLLDAFRLSLWKYKFKK